MSAASMSGENEKECPDFGARRKIYSWSQCDQKFKKTRSLKEIQNEWAQREKVKWRSVRILSNRGSVKV